MRLFKILLTTAVLFTSAGAYADVKIVTPYQGMKSVSTAKTDMNEDNVLTYCARLAYEDNDCIRQLSSLTLKYIYRKNHKEARKWASYIKKYNDQEYQNIPCEVKGVSYPDKGIGVFLEYNSLIFYIDEVENKSEAKKSGLKAFLCQSVTDAKINVSKSPLDSHNFSKFLKKYYGDSDEYDGGRFLAEFMSVLLEKEVEIKGNPEYYSDKVKMERLVKYQALYKNAYNACIKERFAEEFCGYIEEWAQWYQRRKVNMAEKGKF
ncbi:hypothetical protein WHT83_20920 [Aminobacter sp. P9b]|uniref:hypothetical protein n=1 Tax=Aminobacter sp. P9b TaxID=3133697 RepID=UPI003248FB40